MPANSPLISIWSAPLFGTSLIVSMSDRMSLPDARRDEIATYLEKYSSEAWDTLPSHSFRQVSEEEPLRITATPGWQRIHRHVASTAFTLPAVRSKTNCIACHGDADSGRFAPQSIAIPGG